MLVTITMNRDIARLDIRLLLAFNALVETRNVTRAAEKLGLSQQGLSGQLSRLRELFDDPLFVRTSSGVVPTPRADTLAITVRRALSQLEEVVAPQSFDPRQYHATAAIAASDYAQALILPRLLANIRSQAPNLALTIRPVDASSLAVDLRDNLIDLALTVPQFAPQGLCTQRLFNERYVGVARAQHPLLKRRKVSLDAFCNAAHLLVAPYHGDARGPTDSALAALDRKRNISLVVPGFAVAGALLEQTDLIAVLPARLVKSMRRDLVTFKTPVVVEGFSLDVFWPQRLDASPAHCWLRQAVADASASAVQP